MKDLSQTALLVMAGGFGTRLRPLTDNLPKPLVKVAGKPMLDRILEQAIQSGIKKILISVHYFADKVVDHVEAMRVRDVDIVYLREEIPLGTGGCLRLALPHLKSTNELLVVNGDVVCEIPFREIVMHAREHSSDACMVLRNHVIQNPFGVVEVENGNVLRMSEKPRYEAFINTGIYYFKTSSLPPLESERRIDLPTIVEKLIEQKKQVTPYQLLENWFDVGTVEALKLAEQYCLEKEIYGIKIDCDNSREGWIKKITG